MVAMRCTAPDRREADWSVLTVTPVLGPCAPFTSRYADQIDSSKNRALAPFADRRRRRPDRTKFRRDGYGKCHWSRSRIGSRWPQHRHDRSRLDTRHREGAPSPSRSHNTDPGTAAAASLTRNTGINQLC